MRKLFTQMLRATLLLFVMMAFFQVDAQKRYSPLDVSDFQYTIENDVQLTTTTMQFDLYIKDIDPAQPFELAAVQAGVLVNKSISTAPTTGLSVSINSNSSDLVPAMVPTSVTIADGGASNPSQMIIKLASKIQPPCGQGTILSTSGLGHRICTIKITSTTAFVANSQPGLVFCFTTTPYPTKVFQRVGCVGTELTCNAGNSHAGTYYVNPFLNPSPTAYPTLLNMSPTSNVCGATGTIGVSGATQATVTYTLYKDGVAQTPEIVGTGAAISWPGQVGSAAGILYKVKARITATPASARWMTGNILITTTPVITFNPLTDVCETAAAFPLVATPVVGTFTGTGVTFVPATLSYTFDPASAGVGGPYDITYAYSKNGCAAVPVTQTISVEATPVITFDPPVGNICVGTTYTLSATPAGGVFSGTYVTGNQFTPAAVGNYPITYNYTSPAGCAATPVTNPYNAIICLVPPAVVTLAANPVASTSATLNGTVDALGSNSTVTFEWGTTTAYGQSFVLPAPVTGFGATPVSYAIPAGQLTASTLYHFRVKASSAGGNANGADLTFTTDAAVPVLSTVVTDAATLITSNSAQLNGTVTANGSATTVTFQWGLTTAYLGGTVSVPGLVTGTTATPVSANLPGLAPSTLYHYRCVGVNAAGTTNGNDMTFTTGVAVLPTVVTNAATSVLPSSATLNGTVTANGSPTTVTFEYGLTTAYGTPVPGSPSPVPGGPTAVTANISGLAGNTLYHFRCVGVNASGTTYGNDMTFTTPCPPAGQAGPITGPTQVCQGGCGYVYTVTIPNATGYIWTLPVGGTITSGANTNTITVCYADNALSGYLFVYGTSACGSGPPSQLGIAMNAPANPVINGPATACVNTPGMTYTTQAGMTNYNWVVSAGGLITAGGGTTNSSVTVTWQTAGPKTVSVNYTNANGCAGLAPAVFNVTVNAQPVPVINGPVTACTSFPTVFSTDAGMTLYNWNISSGGSIIGQGTASITATWTTTGAHWVSVNYVDANGCTASAPVVKNVTVNSGAAPTITGITNTCVNVGYITYTTQPGMTGYNWTISPGGIINFGSGTNSILVTWVGSGAQWVAVSYTNASGCAPYMPTQLNVNVNALPDDAGEITGPTDVCGGASGVMYMIEPVLNAQAYIWSVPTGAVISFGSGTTTIIVDFLDDASSGDITVYANNVCGNGLASPPLTLVVTPVPATPVVTPDQPVVGDTLFSSAPEGNQWYFNGDPILGATDPYYIPTEIGVYWVIVSVGGCASDESNHVDVIIGMNDMSATDFQIYPIPNDGKFNVSVFSPAKDTYTITVYNNLGAKIYESGSFDVKGTVTKVVDLKPIAQGIYSVVLRSGSSHVDKKVLINK